LSLGSAVTIALERLVAPVEEMHQAISSGWFGVLGPIGSPVRLAHDTVSSLVYNSVRVGARAAGLSLDRTVTVEPGTADSVRAFASGLWGDALGRHEDRLGISMTVRDRQGAPVGPGPEMNTAFVPVTGRLVVLVHGLIKTERCWDGSDTKPGLLQMLDAGGGVTPVAIRYNTGLGIATNGARLATLLEEIHSDWPIPVRSVALVGHSMGGLVVRSACNAGRAAGHDWVEDVTDVVTIGTPHRGAPLEKLVGAAALGLGVAPQTRPLAAFLNTRSAGIKDLGMGDDGGTEGQDDIRYHFIAGVITSNPAHPFGAVVGDLMVHVASSAGPPHLEPENVAVLGGVSHFDLLHDPAVIERVVGWLE